MATTEKQLCFVLGTNLKSHVGNVPTVGFNAYRIPEVMNNYVTDVKAYNKMLQDGSCIPDDPVLDTIIDTMDNTVADVVDSDRELEGEISTLRKMEGFIKSTALDRGINPDDLGKYVYNDREYRNLYLQATKREKEDKEKRLSALLSLSRYANDYVTTLIRDIDAEIRGT
jgi:hypothetical protein